MTAVLSAHTAGVTLPATVAPRPSARAGGTGRAHAQASSWRLETSATTARTLPRSDGSRDASAAASSSSTRVTAATPLGPMSPRRMTSSARSRS